MYEVPVSVAYTRQSATMIIQWNLSNADTIGTIHACPEHVGINISGAFG